MNGMPQIIISKIKNIMNKHIKRNETKNTNDHESTVEEVLAALIESNRMLKEVQRAYRLDENSPISKVIVDNEKILDNVK